MKRNVNGVTAAILPVLFVDSEARLRAAVSEVWRDVHLNAHLLGKARCLGVATRNENATIGEELHNINMNQKLTFHEHRCGPTVASEW